MALNSERFQFEKFKYWCCKVLPLVYDDSLSYYELLCKVYEYLNKLIDEVLSLEEAIELLKKYIDEYFDNLDLQEEVNNYLNIYVHSDEFYELIGKNLAINLIDISSYDIYAQVLPDRSTRFNSGWSSQGFCIGRYNNRPVTMNCFIHENNDDNKIVWTDMLTGEEITSVTATIGHGNSCCYCPETDLWYVATMTGTYGGILAFNINGQQVGDEVKPLGSNCWAITYNSGRFYAMINNGRFAVLNTDLEVIEVHTIDTISERFTYQGLFSDVNYLYLPNGNMITSVQPTAIKPCNRNRISVYTKQGRYIKDIECTFPLEMEECDIYDNECYCSGNSQNSAIICKMDLYSFNSACTLGRKYELNAVTQTTLTAFVNETYTGFHIDLSVNKPLSSIAWTVLLNRNGLTRLDIHIKSDITSSKFFALRECSVEIVSISGDLDTNNKPIYKFPRFDFSGTRCILTNLIIEGEENQTSVNITGTRCYISHITFGAVNSTVKPLRLIWANCAIEIDNIIINQWATCMFYILGGGYIRNITDAYYDTTKRYDVLFAGNIMFDSSCPIERFNNSYLSLLPIGVGGWRRTIDINKVLYPCIIANASTDFTNLPEGVQSTDVRYVQWVSEEKTHTTIKIMKTDNTEIILHN